MKISKLLSKVCGVALSTLLLSAIARADVKLHPLFSDDMVLQRDKPIPVWGTATPGEEVNVMLTLQSASGRPDREQRTVADAQGNWRVTLKPMSASNSPILVLDVKGHNEIVLKNVAVGDVYICSGQSNMEFGIGIGNNAASEIAAANYPNIRLFAVPHQISGTPQKNFAAPTQWKVCTPQNIAAGGWGGFSAAAYFFGRELNQKLGVPIGLIQSAWGGTIAQAWTSRNTLLKRDDLRDATVQTEKAFNDPAPFVESGAAWWQANDVGTKNLWSTPAFDDAAWQSMKAPGIWEQNGLPDFDGVMWFRKTIEIPAAWEGKVLTLRLGSIDDRDTTFWNGAPVGATDGVGRMRVYKIPSSFVKAGRAVLSIRVLDTGGGGGFSGGTDPMRLEVADNATQSLDLTGDWKYQVSTALKDLPKDVPPAPPMPGDNPNQPTVLFNGMIAPLVPFSVRGAIWYQGESNAGAAAQYRTLFPDLIKDWRSVWNAKQDGSEFGFYFVQLASFMARSTQPIESGWAELRDAQTNTLKVVPRTGMATILDIGDAVDIHPKDKQDVGKRLALAALATEYKQPIEYSGPMFSSMKIEGNKVRIAFSHATGLRNTGHVRATEVGGKVPLSSWVYEDLQKLNQAGIIEGYPAFDNFGKYPLSRKELAMAILKILSPLNAKEDEIEKSNPVTKEEIDQSFYPKSDVALRPELAKALLRLYSEFRLEVTPILTATNRHVPDAAAQVFGFSIRGEDGQWYWAQAYIDGESVVLWNDKVLQPKAVAYAWANNPDVNLVNGAGLPAIPFRTDVTK